MIALKELRLNNWVYSPEVGANVQITLLSNDNWLSFNSVTWDQPSCEDIEPIPLTEELLLKCGFSLLKEFSAGKKYAFIVNNSYNDSISFIVWYIDDKIVCNIPNLKYLHQLQNAIFALTNQELEINL